MKAVMRTIRILVAVLFVDYISCQDGFSEQDLLRLQQMALNEGQVETITSYSTNNIQRDPIRNEHTLSSGIVKYRLQDDPEGNDEYNRGVHGRSDRRKVFHIRNPFQRQMEDDERRQQESAAQKDAESGASNQYPSIQYSLPPEEFLRQMRAESQYLPQYSTPAPNVGYTATPQPQYHQYSTSSPTNFDNNQNQNQLQQIESRNINIQQQHQQQQHQQQQQQQYQQQQQSYQPNVGQYQYGGSYSYESASSSPLPPYLSTPNNPFVSTPENTFVSSSSPIFLSSQQSLPQYVSSPISVTQTGTPDFPVQVTTAGSGNSYNFENNDQNKRMQIDHYDNSANGIRFPINRQQYSGEFVSSTPVTPSSSPYSDPINDSWQNSINSGNTLSKSLQEISYSQFQNSPYRQQQDGRLDIQSSHDSGKSDPHRDGNNIPAANNVYLNYVQPDYQTFNNIRTRARESEQEANQPEMYSNGEYGWKMGAKKSAVGNDEYTVNNMPSRFQTFALQQDGQKVSPMNFQFDGAKSSNYEPISKSASDSYEAQEFAKAAAQAHDNMKQQQFAKYTEPYYGHDYASSFSALNPGNSVQTQPNVVTTFYGNIDIHRNKLQADGSNLHPTIYGNSQSDVITGSPYYISNSKDSNTDSKSKQPFDHLKALKQIVPIDVSNVVSNNDQKSSTVDANRYTIANYQKDQLDQNLKQYYKPLTDSYYKDKYSGYGYNIKTRPDELTASEGIKQVDQNSPYYGKQSAQDAYNQYLVNENKKLGESAQQQASYLAQAQNHYQNFMQSGMHLQGSSPNPQNQMQQSDITSMLKLNDIPYRLTQGLNTEALRFNNNHFDQTSMPTPIPTRINQNVGSHQIDVASSILTKLLQNKQQGLISSKPEIDLPSGGSLSTINGFRVANPFNVDLKLVAEMLKGKPVVDETRMIAIRDPYGKAQPMKLDMSSLQQLLLKNDNYGNLGSLGDGVGAIGSPYMEIYNSGRYPYQGPKYSRSQEEEENIPIADASNTHPIGAVVEQDEMPIAREVNSGSDVNGPTDDEGSNDYEDNRLKNLFSRDHRVSKRPRHENFLIPGRHPYQRKYPKSEVAEPYPLLKPPPTKHSRSRFSHGKSLKRRHRFHGKPKIARMFHVEPLFEGDSKPVEETESPMPILQPPPPVVDEKMSEGNDSS